MREDLDKELCEKYPYMFQERNLPMSQTCMCWGFAHGDGWYNIVKALCSSIHNHIKWVRESRARALLYNRRLKKAIKTNQVSLLLTRYIDAKSEVPEWAMNEALTAMQTEAYHPVPEKVQRVVVEQVKEKFGTLRFYYRGGDACVAGMVSLAEAMSALTCEVCGNPADTAQHGGWVGTLCEEHAKQRKEQSEQYD